MQVNVTDILNATKRDGGGTFRLDGGHIPTIGCMVGGDPECPEQRITRWEVRHGPLLHAAVLAYASRAVDAGTPYLGTWVDGEDLVLDAPTWALSIDSGRALALARGERAIYFLTTGETIYI